MTLRALHFGAPLWLLAGLLLAGALVLLELRLARQRRRALADFSARARALTSSLSRPLRLLKAILTVMGVALICAALARPQLGYREEETFRRGLDLMFVIDTSKSMLTPDLKPNRLARAKLALYDLTSKFEGDRVGLVAFAGDAFLQAPLTLDRGMFDQTLDAVDTTLIPRGGTDLGRAIGVAVEALRSQPQNRKLMVILTDGEDLEAGALAAARAAAAAGVRIYTVGVGTPGGDLIPEPGGGFVKDGSGGLVRSRLDEHTLAEIASVTGGQYRALGADGRGLALLYQDVLAKLPRDTVGERLHRIPLERFQWPLGLGALCLALEALLQERRRRVTAKVGAQKALPFHARARAPRSAAAAGIALALGLGASARARASVTDAQRDYQAGRFSQAAEEYRQAHVHQPGDSRLELNLGAATYKAGNYAAAGAALQGALHSARDSARLDLQQRAYYDLGNTQYRLGEASLAADPEKTIAAWKQAVTSYEGALKLDARDADAAFNRALVQQKLAALQQKQKQKQDQQKQNQHPGQSQQPDSQQAKSDKPSPANHSAGQKQGGQGDSGRPEDAPGTPSQKQTAEKGQTAPQPQRGAGQESPGQGTERAQGAHPGQDPATPQPGQGEKPPAPQVAQGGHPSPTAGQAGQPATPFEARPDGAGSQAQSAGDEASPEEPVKPGQLSRADARALLNSLRGDERLMTAAGPNNRTHTDDAPVQRDW